MQGIQLNTIARLCIHVILIPAFAVLPVQRPGSEYRSKPITAPTGRAECATAGSKLLSSGSIRHACGYES